MDSQIIQNRYSLWLEKVTDSDLRNELLSMSQEQKENAFYKELSFGTGGLRGILGAGTACMNVYIVARATQGLANHILSRNASSKRVIIGYDTRILSKEFAQVAANVLAQNNIQAYVFSQALPTPCVSFGVRELKADYGIVITASHNPSKYNGYKVYNEHGCQITTEEANKIYSQIQKLDYFDCPFEETEIEKVPDFVFEKYLEAVQEQSILPIQNPDIKIIYSPLNGTGLIPVTKTLEKAGFKNIILVEEQKEPDGRFPTCPKPNPEEKEAMQLGIQYARQNNSDLVLATDPDCDRVSIAVKDKEDYQILSANELGCLLLEYILANKKYGKNAVVCKTIVTTDLVDMICQHYGVRVINTLTGFKFIGEQIGYLEKENRLDDFLFGFEESCGYLSGTYVRDKDATVASLLICEMFANYQDKGISLMEQLQNIYYKYGYCLNTQHSYEFEGASGPNKMNAIMDSFRYEIQTIDHQSIVLKKDYMEGIDRLPPSNVIKLYLDKNASIILRPSGTEPKLKVYYSVMAGSSKEATEMENELYQSVDKIVHENS